MKLALFQTLVSPVFILAVPDSRIPSLHSRSSRLSYSQSSFSQFQTLASPVFIHAVPDSRIPSLHSRSSRLWYPQSSFSQFQTGNVRVKSRAILNKVIADFTLLSLLCEHATTVAQRRELHRTLEIYYVQQQKCKRPAVVGN